VCDYRPRHTGDTRGDRHQIKALQPCNLHLNFMPFGYVRFDVTRLIGSVREVSGGLKAPVPPRQRGGLAWDASHAQSRVAAVIL
jgi:hypothetical protein